MHILFLCVANSARSQMAEGLAKRILGEGFQIQSAGSHPSIVHPLAQQALSEVHIDISNQHSKSVKDISLKNLDYVITLCQEEVCPTLPDHTRHLHWPHSDPASLSDDALDGFRQVRDQIQLKLEEFKSSFLK